MSVNDDVEGREFRARPLNAWSPRLRWFGALGLSLIAFVVTSVVVLVLVFGVSRFPGGGLLFWLTDLAFGVLEGWIGDVSARFVLIMLLGLPSWLAAVLVFAWCTRQQRVQGEFLHCLRCNYILKGLSEPRCPECGERI